MKKLFTIACTLALGCVMSFAQAASQTPAPAGGSTDTTKSDTTKTKKKSKKAAKKAKKGATADTTAQPK